jgi:hypothetical protein
MAALVILVTRHKLALSIFEKEASDLLNKNRMPSAIADRTELLPSTFNPDKAGGLTLEQFIMQGGSYEPMDFRPTITGVIVLCEEPFEYLLRGIRNAIFAAVVPSIPYVENVKNLLIGHFRLLLGNYGFLVELISDATKHQAASLPIRNFHAQELHAVVDACLNHSLKKTFKNEITPLLNQLIKRRGPKRRSSYPDVYFKDESQRYFKYGHERHSRYETGGTHISSCIIHGKFRFGWALDQDRHFNVTVGDSDAREGITCQLPNCHDELVHIRNRTHINLFSNDFHA